MVGSEEVTKEEFEASLGELARKGELDSNLLSRIFRNKTLPESTLFLTINLCKKHKVDLPSLAVADVFQREEISGKLQRKTASLLVKEIKSLPALSVADLFQKENLPRKVWKATESTLRKTVELQTRFMKSNKTRHCDWMFPYNLLKSLFSKENLPESVWRMAIRRLEFSRDGNQRAIISPIFSKDNVSEKTLLAAVKLLDWGLCFEHVKALFDRENAPEKVVVATTIKVCRTDWEQQRVIRMLKSMGEAGNLRAAVLFDGKTALPVREAAESSLLAAIRVCEERMEIGPVDKLMKSKAKHLPEGVRVAAAQAIAKRTPDSVVHTYLDSLDARPSPVKSIHCPRKMGGGGSGKFQQKVLCR